jgi:hypothetical protein
VKNPKKWIPSKIFQLLVSLKIFFLNLAFIAF